MFIIISLNIIMFVSNKLCITNHANMYSISIFDTGLVEFQNFMFLLVRTRKCLWISHGSSFFQEEIHCSWEFLINIQLSIQQKFDLLCVYILQKSILLRKKKKSYFTKYYCIKIDPKYIFVFIKIKNVKLVKTSSSDLKIVLFFYKNINFTIIFYSPQNQVPSKIFYWCSISYLNIIVSY